MIWARRASGAPGDGPPFPGQGKGPQLWCILHVQPWQEVTARFASLDRVPPCQTMPSHTFRS